jgi:hypothetical protein
VFAVPPGDRVTNVFNIGSEVTVTVKIITEFSFGRCS